MARVEGAGVAVVWARRVEMVASREVMRDWRARMRSWEVDILREEAR